MKRSKNWLILLMLAVFFTSATWVFASQLTKKLNEDIQIGEMNLSKVEDGVYKESYFYNEAMGATVVVTVMNHQIETIIIQEHKTGMGKKAEQIVNRVIDEQSLQVDAVSGATASSRIILKAIERVLK